MKFCEVCIRGESSTKKSPNKLPVYVWDHGTAFGNQFGSLGQFSRFSIFEAPELNSEPGNRRKRRSRVASRVQELLQKVVGLFEGP